MEKKLTLRSMVKPCSERVPALWTRADNSRLVNYTKSLILSYEYNSSRRVIIISCKSHFEKLEWNIVCIQSQLFRSHISILLVQLLTLGIFENTTLSINNSPISIWENPLLISYWPLDYLLCDWTWKYEILSYQS